MQRLARPGAHDRRVIRRTGKRLDRHPWRSRIASERAGSDAADGRVVAATKLVERVLLDRVVVVVAQPGAQLDELGRGVAHVRIACPAVANLVEGVVVTAARVDQAADRVALPGSERRCRAVLVIQHAIAVHIEKVEQLILGGVVNDLVLVIRPCDVGEAGIRGRGDAQVLRHLAGFARIRRFEDVEGRAVRRFGVQHRALVPGGDGRQRQRARQIPVRGQCNRLVVLASARRVVLADLVIRQRGAGRGAIARTVVAEAGDPARRDAAIDDRVVLRILHAL